jgi:O-antigen ligase
MAFWGILIYLFFFFIRPQDWWEPIKGFPVIDFLIPFILITNLHSIVRLQNVLKLSQSKFFILFVFAVFLSNIVNNNIDAAFEYGWQYLKIAIIFLVIIITVDSLHKLKVLTIFIILLIAFIAYQSIIQIETGINWAGITIYKADTLRTRWVGSFDGPNIVALSFVMVMPFIIGYLFDPWSKFYKIFSIVIGFFLLKGFYLADSRGGFLSLLIVIFSFLTMRAKNKRRIIVAFIIVLLLFVIAAPARMSEIDDPEKSARGRINAWIEGLEMVRYHNPLLGVGKGQFTIYSSLVAHNAFLQQIGETGLIGTFFWIGVIYMTMKGLLLILKNKEQKDIKYSLYRSYFISLIGTLSGLFFLSAEFILYLIIPICIAILLIEEITLKFTLKDLMIIGGIEIGGITGAYIAINLFKAIYF